MARRRKPTHAYRLTQWARYEPDPKYLKGEPTPLRYLTVHINEHSLPGRPAVTRATIEYEEQLLTEVGGGPWLEAVYLRLLKYAGDRAYLREFLLTPHDEPATLAEIARRHHLTRDELGKAIRLLSCPPLNLIERVPVEEVKQLVRARKAHARAESTPSGGRHTPAQEVPQGASPDGATDEEEAATPKGGAPPGTDGQQSDLRGATMPAPAPLNSNGKLPASAGKRENSASLAGGGNAGNRKQKTAQRATHLEQDGPNDENADSEPAPAAPGNEPGATRTGHAGETADRLATGRGEPASACAPASRPPTESEARGEPATADTEPARSDDRGGTVGGCPPPTVENRRFTGVSAKPIGSAVQEILGEVRPPDGTVSGRGSKQPEGRGWQPPPAEELPTEPDAMLWRELAEAIGAGWWEVRSGPRRAMLFGASVSYLLGMGVGRGAVDEIVAMGQRWSDCLVAPIDDRRRLWLAERMLRLAAELGKRRQQDMRRGREDLPNYAAIWMAEVKKGLQAAIGHAAASRGPPAA